MFFVLANYGIFLVKFSGGIMYEIELTQNFKTVQKL